MAEDHREDLPDMLFSVSRVSGRNRSTSYVPNSVFALEPKLEELGSPTSSSFPVGITLSPTSAKATESRGVQQAALLLTATTETSGLPRGGNDVSVGTDSEIESKAKEETSYPELDPSDDGHPDDDTEGDATEPSRPIRAQSVKPLDSPSLPSLSLPITSEVAFPSSAAQPQYSSTEKRLSQEVDSPTLPLFMLPLTSGVPTPSSAVQSQDPSGEKRVSQEAPGWEEFAMSDTTRRLDEIMTQKYPDSQRRHDKLELDILSERLERELERHPTAFRLDEAQFESSLDEFKKTVAEARSTVQQLTVAVSNEHLSSQQLRTEIARLEQSVDNLRNRKDLGELELELQLAQRLAEFAADKSQRETFLNRQPSSVAPRQQPSFRQIVAPVNESLTAQEPASTREQPLCEPVGCLRAPCDYCNCTRSKSNDFQQRLKVEQERQWQSMMMSRLPRPS